jgi:ribosomal protein S18 acetylase RimI-like enzyme
MFHRVLEGRSQDIIFTQMSLPVKIAEVPLEFRPRLHAILDSCFEGIYRWHAKRILRSVKWVRTAIRGDEPAGLSMIAMFEGSLGYLYYIAVLPSQREAGVGGLLLVDAL